jgi:hypothetical protein
MFKQLNESDLIARSIRRKKPVRRDRRVATPEFPRIRQTTSANDVQLHRLLQRNAVKSDAARTTLLFQPD